MITKSDCLLLLGELKASGLDTIQATANLVKSPDIPIDVIKFINDNR